MFRIILGIAVLAGAWVLKGRAAPAPDAEEVSLTLFGTAIAPSSLNLIVLAFALVGVAMIVLGFVGLAKRR